MVPVSLARSLAFDSTHISGCCLAIRKLARDTTSLDASPNIDCDQCVPSDLGCLPDGLRRKSPHTSVNLQQLIIQTYGSVEEIIISYREDGGSAPWTCADNSNST